MANKNPILSANSIDDLFDYDVGLDDILRDVPNSKENAPKPPAAPDNAGVVLGLDEEVKVAKKRAPVAKLDEPRLLAQTGIPKLRHTAKCKLRFKGKGHELSDLARLLNFYQLWLDDLYPRAKFADGLAIIEKLGHSRRLQTMRREWIEEEKPKYREDSTLDAMQANKESQSAFAEEVPSHNVGKADQLQSGPNADSLDQDLFMPHEDNQHQHIEDRDLPEDDDLDVLLREQEHEGGLEVGFSVPDERTDSHSIDPFADDIEALDELDIFGDAVP